MPTDFSPDTDREDVPAATSPASPRLADILTLHDVALYSSDISYSRGKTYHRQHRVSDLSVSPDLKSITALVSGSRPKPYQQSISLLPRANARTKITGTCSCPMASNCKHIAAVLIEALTGPSISTDLPTNIPLALPEFVPPPRPATLIQSPLPYDVANWLDQLALTAVGNEYPPTITQRLLYLITPHTPLNAAPHLAVELVAARLLKAGDFSHSVTRPSLSNFYRANWPGYFRSSDIGISEALLADRTGHNSRSYTFKSLTLLNSIVATGRAFWQIQNGVRLRMGDPRPGEIEWTMPDNRGMRPVLQVENALSLNAEPPVYIDVEQGLIGEVTLSISPKLAYGLLSAPAIPAAHVEQVSKTLGRHLPSGTSLIPKAPEPPVTVESDPTPVLHLMLTDTVNTRNWSPQSDTPVARLVFRYGSIDINYGNTDPVVDAIKGKQRYQVRRRITKEKHATGLLFDLGLRLAREIHSLADPAHHHDLAFPDPYHWLDFLSKDAANLQAQGFEITVDDDFPYRLAKPSGDIDTEVFESTGTDWFELGLGVQVDGNKLDLAPLLANLVLTDGLDPAAVTALAQEGNDIYVPLDDGRHLALAAKRFLPVIIALHELTMGGTVVAKNGRLQISKAETALLSGFEGQEGIVFKGSDNLRRLANALRAGPHGGIAPLALPHTFKAVLRPYQSEGVAWLNLLRDVGLGGILADDMGLGKTVQILALLCVEKAAGRLQKPVLIIAPTSLMTNWQNEAAKFAPQLSVLLLHGPARKGKFDAISTHDIVLTTYPLIARDQLILLEHQWHMAILDEAQVIKNPNAATTKLIRDLKADHRFCLTGTPMENHLGELWSLMTFVNPGYLGDKSVFVRRWRTPIEKYGDVERSQILSRRVKPFMLRRTKQQVAAELPSKTEITEFIPLDNRQRDVYDSIRLSMHKKVRQAIAAKGLAKSHIIILEALLKLRQVCCDPRLLKLKDAGPAPPSAKLERLMEMMAELLSEGRKIIVFSQFTSMLALIGQRFHAAGIEFSLLTGDTIDRKSAIESFQSGLVNTFLVSLKAGGVGLNLTAADTVILYDPWWNPAVEEQAIDRAYRIGQDKPVFVYRLVASQTIEEKMDELKAKKRALAAGIFDQAGNPASAMTEEDLNSLFDV